MSITATERENTSSYYILLHSFNTLGKARSGSVISLVLLLGEMMNKTAEHLSLMNEMSPARS